MPVAQRKVYYPEYDGEPIAENTTQFDWIALLKWNIDVLFRNREVFVAGDNFIYPIEGDAKTRLAPDVYVAFGRPKGRRGSYRVWDEGQIFPQVIFEVLSPSNTPGEMEKKKEFYGRHGVEEYYVLQPEEPMYLEGWRRVGDGLQLIPADDAIDFVSPRLGTHFVTRDGIVQVFGPDGKLWDTPLTMLVDAFDLVEKAEARTDEAQERADHFESARDRVQAERDRVQAERDRVQAERDRLAEKLRQLGIDPNSP